MRDNVINLKVRFNFIKCVFDHWCISPWQRFFLVGCSSQWRHRQDRIPCKEKRCWVCPFFISLFTLLYKIFIFILCSSILTYYKSTSESIFKQLPGLNFYPFIYIIDGWDCEEEEATDYLQYEQVSFFLSDHSQLIILQSKKMRLWVKL